MVVPVMRRVRGLLVEVGPVVAFALICAAVMWCVVRVAS